MSPQLLRDNCPVPGPQAAGLSRHWFGQFPLPSSSVVTQASVLGGELPQGEYIYTLSVVTAPGSGHWLTLGSRRFTMRQVPSHRLSGELTVDHFTGRAASGVG